MNSASGYITAEQARPKPSSAMSKSLLDHSRMYSLIMFKFFENTKRKPTLQYINRKPAYILLPPLALLKFSTRKEPSNISFIFEKTV
jgi:hypothetical protein